MTPRLALLGSLVLLATAPLGGCRDGEHASIDFRHHRGGGGTPVATFGEDVVTAEELEQRFLEMSPFLRSRYQTLEEKRAYAEGLARFELLAREAVRRGLHNDPEVVVAAKKVMVQRLLKDELERKGSPVSEEELAAWYRVHQGDFQRPEMVRLSHVFLAAHTGRADGTGGGAAEVRARAEALLARARALPAGDGAAFARLAAEHDEDPRTRPLQGDLRFQSREELTRAYGPAVAEAGFALTQPGQLSGVVEAAHGFHILRLEGRTPAVNVSLEEPQTRARIIQAIRTERQVRDYEALLSRLREQDRLTFDDAALSRVPVDLKAPARQASGPAPGYLAPPAEVASPQGAQAPASASPRIPPFPSPR